MRQDKWLFFYFISPSLYYQFGHFFYIYCLNQYEGKSCYKDFWGISSTRVSREILCFSFSISHRFRFIRSILSLENFFFLLLQQIKRRANEGNSTKLFLLQPRVKLISILHMSFITVTAVSLAYFFHIFFISFLFLLSIYKTYEGKKFRLKKSFHLQKNFEHNLQRNFGKLF